MKIYYDTEFLEDGRTIDLISIGMVAEDGREYYAVNQDAPWKRIRRHEWLMQNVVPYLPRGHGDWRNHMPKRWLVDFTDPRIKPKDQIADEVRRFLLGDDPHDAPEIELWAWYGAYDHVALCQLWGPMIDLPRGVPMWTNDLRQEVQRLGNPRMPEQTDRQHNALADARHVKAMAEYAMVLAAERATQSLAKGFGRRNPHCSNCGDLRGGPFGHEISECKYRQGMTAEQVAGILPPHQRGEFWDVMLDRYFERELSS